MHSHFPTEADLFTGCTSQVAAHAPIIAIDKILQATTLAAAFKRLVTAMEAQHRYYEPWSGDGGGLLRDLGAALAAN